MAGRAQSGHGSLRSTGSLQWSCPTIQLVLGTEKQAGHQGRLLSTQPVSPIPLLWGSLTSLHLNLLSVTKGSCNVFKSQKSEWRCRS